MGDSKYYAYAIVSQDHDYIYKGITNNLERRLGEHNSGNNKTTRPYRPFRLLYEKGFASRPEARVHEKWLKSGQGRQYLQSLS